MLLSLQASLPTCQSLLSSPSLPTHLAGHCLSYPGFCSSDCRDVDLCRVPPVRPPPPSQQYQSRAENSVRNLRTLYTVIILQSFLCCWTEINLVFLIQKITSHFNTFRPAAIIIQFKECFRLSPARLKIANISNGFLHHQYGIVVLRFLPSENKCKALSGPGDCYIL